MKSSVENFDGREYMILKTEFNLLRNNKGVSLLSTVVALGVVGVIAATLSKVMTNSMKQESRVNLLTNLNSIKSLINEQLNCAQTLNEVVAKWVEVPTFRYLG